PCGGARVRQDEWDLQTLDYYRYMDRLARTGGEPDPAEAEIGAGVLAGYTGPIAHERIVVSLLKPRPSRCSSHRCSAAAETPRRARAPSRSTRSRVWSESRRRVTASGPTASRGGWAVRSGSAASRAMTHRFSAAYAGSL